MVCNRLMSSTLFFMIILYYNLDQHNYRVPIRSEFSLVPSQSPAENYLFSCKVKVNCVSCLGCIYSFILKIRDLNILACFFNNFNLPLVILHRLILLLSLSKIDLRVEFGCKQKLLMSTMFQKSTSIRNILLLLHLWNIRLLIGVIFLTIANLGSYIYIHTHICKFQIQI